MSRDAVGTELRAGFTLGVKSVIADAPGFEPQLPRGEAGSRGSVVILRPRGKQELGSTFIGANRQSLAAADAWRESLGQ